MGIYKRALIALSLNERADQPLIDKAKALIAQGTEAFFIHSVEYFVSYESAFAVGAGIETDVLLIDKATDHLTQFLLEVGLDSHQQVVLEGPPAQSIVDYAKEIAADLIVLGSHGRHGVKLLLGNTANGVLHHTNCDVLAVRLQE